MSKNSIRLYSFLLLAQFLWVTPAYAWGQLGHQVICDAGWRLSPRDVRRELGKAAKRMGYGTFAEACVWPDRIRNKPRFHWTNFLHYVNVPKAADRVIEAPCLQDTFTKPTCVLTAINYFHQQISDQSLPQSERDEALLFLAHYVGDLHQPLHVSYKYDRGGTQTKVIFEGKLLSLHRLWDVEILTCSYHRSWRHLGKNVYRQVKKNRTESTSVVNWADESLAITKVLYRQLSQRLDKGYCDRYHPIARERLNLAADRLAGLLEVLVK